MEVKIEDTPTEETYNPPAEMTYSRPADINDERTTAAPNISLAVDERGHHTEYRYDYKTNTLNKVAEPTPVPAPAPKEPSANDSDLETMSVYLIAAYRASNEILDAQKKIRSEMCSHLVADISDAAKLSKIRLALLRRNILPEEKKPIPKLTKEEEGFYRFLLNAPDLLLGVAQTAKRSLEEYRFLFEAVSAVLKDKGTPEEQVAEISNILL